MTDKKPLQGRTIVYVSVGGFSGVTRTIKQARTVAEAGARVVFVGYQGRMPSDVVDSGFDYEEVVYTAAGSQNPMRLLRVAYNLTLFLLARRRAEAGAKERMVEAIVRIQPDIVQSVDLPALDIAVIAARRAGAKVTFDSHEMWTGFLDNPEVGLSDSEKRSLLEMEERFAPEADAVFVVSDEMGRRMVDRYPLKRVLTVFNSPPGHKTEIQPVHRPVRLVFHGSLATTKNVRELILAMGYLREHATLDIHGAGLTLDQDELGRLVEQQGLSDVVSLHGRFEYAAVLDMLQDYDIDVYAAQMLEENFAVSLPNKIFDAICAGLAVAASDFPAIRDVLETAECGAVLDPSTSESIAEGLRRLIDDPETVERMKANSVAFAPTCTWETQGAKVVACLGELVRTS